MQQHSLFSLNAAASVKALLVLTIHAACFAGCSSTSTPEKKDIGSPPKDAKAGLIWMGVNPPTDTNANGYPDAIVCTVYLFADTGYVRSVSVPGTFTFTLLGKGGVPIREWTVTSPGPRSASIRTGVGEGSIIRLGLNDDGGSDVMAYQSADLIVSFRGVSGDTVKSTPNAVLIGRPGSK